MYRWCFAVSTAPLQAELANSSSIPARQCRRFNAVQFSSCGRTANNTRERHSHTLAHTFNTSSGKTAAPVVPQETVVTSVAGEEEEEEGQGDIASKCVVFPHGSPESFRTAVPVLRRGVHHDSFRCKLNDVSFGVNIIIVLYIKEPWLSTAVNHSKV